MSTTDSRQMKADSRSVLGPERDRLDSWKEIAVYLGREVRTAQRWERREGLPVQRHFHGKGGTVWAFKHEIDTWFNDRCRVLVKPDPRRRFLEPSVDWSSPKVLVARQTGNSCGLVLVIAPGSHPRNGESGVATIDQKVDVRKDITIKRNSIARLVHGNS